MKHLPTIIAILFLVSLSCSRQDPVDDAFPWPWSGVREADSILLLFERNRVKGCVPDTSRRLAAKFSRVADANLDNKMIQARKLFINVCNDMTDSSRSAVKEFLESTDISSMPYEWHKISGLLIDGEQDYVMRYNMIVENLAFFKKAKAEVEYCRHLVHFGNLMFELNDSARAIEAYREADEIALRRGMLTSHVTISLNIAAASPPETADSICSSLRRNSVVRDYPNSYIQLMQNSFILTDSLQFIDRAIDAHRNGKALRLPLYILLALKGDYYTRHGDPSVGLGYIREAFDSLDSSDSKKLARYIRAMHSFKSKAWLSLGENDSALAELNQTLMWTDSIRLQHRYSMIYALDARSRIEITERNASLRQSIITYMWIASSMAMAIVIMVILFIHQKRASEKKQAEERMKEEVRRNRESLMAQTLVMEQTNGLINKISEKISDLSSQGDIDRVTEALLMKELRLYKSNEENANALLRVKQNLDTHFMTRLKADFPYLSESQLRLASLLAAGIDSRQIAGILNIENASVHTARWRLRKRLGISPSGSLEDFLRRYGSSGL